MPQGNAAFSLMPPPFYMYRMVVAKARAPEESIQDQIDKIPDEVVSPTNRYKIEVMPGIYPEAVTMKNYVDVVAPYGRVIIRPPTDTINCVTMADNSMLQGVEISLTNAGPNATGVRMVGVDHVIVEDVWVTDGEGGDIGMNVTNTGTDIIVRKCRIDEVATSFFKDGTGTLWLADCRMTAFAGGIDIDINNGTLNLMDNELMCTGAGANVDVASANTIVVNSFGNTLNGDGWQIGDNTAAWVYSHNDKFTKVTHAGDGHMVAYEEPQTYLVHAGMKIRDCMTDITDAASDKRYTVRVFAGTYSEAVTMESYVDIVGQDRDTVIITQAAATVVTGADNCMLSNLTITLTAGTGQAGVLLHAATDTTPEMTIRMVKMTITQSSGQNWGIRTTQAGSGTAAVYCYDLDITSTGDVARAIRLEGRAASTIEDSVLNGQACDIELDQTTLNSYHNSLIGSGINWGFTNNAASIVRSHGDFFTSVTKGADAIMTCQEKPNIWRVFKGMEIHDAYDSASAGDSIEVGPGSYTTALTIALVLNLVSTDGPEVTTITRTNETPITAGANFTIDGFTINVDAPDAARTCLVCTTFSPNIKNCIFNQTNLGTAGYGVTVTTGAPTIDKCVFGAGFDEAITQADGDTVIRDCTISSGATNGVSITDGLLYISRSKISVVGNGLNTQTNDGIIWADHCDITGAVIDCNVAANCTIYVDCCSYNDVTNGGTFVDLTGCREYDTEGDDDVAVNDWVYVDANDRIKKAKADDLSTMPAIGVVVLKLTVRLFKVKNYGYLYCSSEPWTDAWSIGVGDEWWLSDDTAGEAEHTMPGVWPQRVGVVVSDTGTLGRFKILIGDNLGLVHTNIYDFTYLAPMQGACAYDVDGPPYTDETTEANEATADDMTLWPATPAIGDRYYFGAHRVFTVLNLTVSTNGAGNVVEWEYWNGAWVSLTIGVDGTDAFNNLGTNTVTFTLPGDWVATDDGGTLPVSCFWIRARLTTAGTQSLGTQAWTNAVDVDDWVYITTTADTAAPALATVAETMPAIGVVVEKMATEIRVKTDAKWSQAVKAGWFPGDEAWISDTTVGDIVRVCPVMGVVEKVADVKTNTGNLILEIA